MRLVLVHVFVGFFILLEILSPYTHLLFGDVLYSVTCRLRGSESEEDLSKTAKKIVFLILLGTATLVGDSYFIGAEQPAFITMFIYLGIPIWILGTAISGYQLWYYMSQEKCSKKIDKWAIAFSVFLRFLAAWFSLFVVTINN
ncbi:MAG: hypothetical protein IJ091_07595 [Oscillospiraceae bacterium]|nr:hypothetical protein [Oscillospiraceae bacterium]